MADLGHQMTDEKLEQLERSVHKTYKKAYKEMQDKVDAYFDKLKDRDEEQKALLEAGKITEQQYQQWRLTQYARGERYRALRDEFARRMNEANKVAAAYINDQTPGIYSLNANYTAYTIEQSGSAADFNLIQEQAVKRLIEEEPELFHRPAIDTPLDTVWNQRKLTDSLTAGILMGESTRQIADRFQKVTDMNRTSALRNARTAVTGAQNAGRQATYDKARAMGIEVDERWRSARDFRVRDSHRLMDGKPKDKDGYFHTPLGSIMRYPGDMQNGKAADVYNCRCTTSTKDALEAEPTMMRARDPVTGRNEVVQDMTYQEWYEWKLEQYGEDTIQLAELKIKHKNADQKQFENYRSVLGKNAPKTFEDFQNLKYNGNEIWKLTKLDYKRRNDLINHPEKALPMADTAEAAEAKFTRYLFNPDNAKGWAKGVNFEKRLGYNADNWQLLQKEILDQAKLYPAAFKGNDGFGDKYEQKLILRGATNKPTNVIVAWICEERMPPRMTSAYIKEVKEDED